MRGTENKTFKKKNHISGIVIKGDKKNIGHICGKITESGEIKKTFDLFYKRLMSATKKNKQKKTSLKKKSSHEVNFSFRVFTSF